jgi:hypothetical protein
MASDEAPSEDGPAGERVELARTAQVHLHGVYRDFASLSAEDVAERAEELKSSGN